MREIIQYLDLQDKFQRLYIKRLFRLSNWYKSNFLIRNLICHILMHLRICANNQNQPANQTLNPKFYVQKSKSKVAKIIKSTNVNFVNESEARKKNER